MGFNFLKNASRPSMIKLKSQILSDLFCAYHGAYGGAYDLSGTGLVHCTDIQMPLERLFGIKKLELGIMLCLDFWKRFLKRTLIHVR